jgi:hypothetical protein
MGQMGTAKSHMQQLKIPQIIGSGLLSYILYTSSLIPIQTSGNSRSCWRFDCGQPRLVADATILYAGSRCAFSEYQKPFVQYPDLFYLGST